MYELIALRSEIVNWRSILMCRIEGLLIDTCPRYINTSTTDTHGNIKRKKHIIE